MINNRYTDVSTLNLETIRIFGAPDTVNSVLVNGVAHTDFEVLESNEIQVRNLKVPVNSEYTIVFKYSDSSSRAHAHFGFNFILFYVSLLYALLRHVM